MPHVTFYILDMMFPNENVPSVLEYVDRPNRSEIILLKNILGNSHFLTFIAKGWLLVTAFTFCKLLKRLFEAIGIKILCILGKNLRRCKCQWQA
jgi:hypothetical protein